MPRYYSQIDGREYSFEIVDTLDGTLVRQVGEADEAKECSVDFAAVHAHPSTGEGLYSLLIDGKSYQLYLERTEDGLRVALSRHRFEVEVLTEREWRLQKVAPKQTVENGPFILKAPMPGLIKSVLVGAGDGVSDGQRLLVLEAMKMENDINSPRKGRITVVHVQPGTIVEGGKPLITLE